MRRSPASVLLLLSTVACTDAASSTPSRRVPVRAAQVVAPDGTIRGRLLEQMPVGPYLYVRLETEGGELWAAVNEATLEVGDSVTVYNAMLMEQFQSQTLKRTFARLYFGSLQPVNRAPMTAGTSPESASSAAPGMSGSPGAPAAVDAKVGVIAKAGGANAYTIGDLWTRKEQLAGQRVSVRGVVVKYNPSVMGKNWLHLQDGSGSAANGTIDLTVTSTDKAAIGDTVTVMGVVRTNQDLGAGYSYALLLETATVTKR